MCFQIQRIPNSKLIYCIYYIINWYEPEKSVVHGYCMAFKNAAAPSQLCQSACLFDQEAWKILKSWSAGKLLPTQWYFPVLVVCQPVLVHTTHHKQLFRICSMHVQCSTLVIISAPNDGWMNLIPSSRKKHGIGCFCRFSACHYPPSSTAILLKKLNCGACKNLSKIVP